MPRQITNHGEVLNAIQRVDIISELIERENGRFTYELDLEVSVYGRNYTGKKVGPYLKLLVFDSGEAIIHEGDWGGNNFFILVDGELDVYVAKAGRQEKVSVIHPGKSFGEMSVLAGVPRNATIKVPAGSQAKVLEVERPALRLLRKLPKFGNLLDSTYREYGLRRTLKDVIEASGIVFDSELVSRLEELAEFRIYGKQHTLFSEGQPADRIFFIKSGWVQKSRGAGAPSLHDMMEIDEEVSVDFAGAGSFMGDDRLKQDSVWDYTATVLARTEVLEFPLSKLLAEPALLDALERFLSRLTPEGTRSQVRSDLQVVAAASTEITTGIINGANLLVMDMDLCVRCGNCSLACHKIHGQSRLLRRGIEIERPKKIGATSVQHVLVPSVCMHCRDPECLTGCPTGAIGRFPGGQIDINPKTCIGCSDCATQCPYNAISMVPRTAAAPTPSGWGGRIRGWLSLAPPTLPPPVTETENLLAVKCNLCNNTPLNPKGARTHAYSCEENCPTGALVRVNPREYFSEVSNSIGFVYRDETHAIGRNIHKSDPTARWWHVGGILGTLLLTGLTIWAIQEYTLDGRLNGSWLTVRWLTGFVGLGGIAGVIAYPFRKQVYRRRAGPLRYWMLAHVYLGVIAGIILLLHGGTRSGGVLTSLLMVSFDLVILSGLFGIACYLIVPRIMTRIEEAPLLYEDLIARRRELRETLAKIDTSDEELQRLIKEKVRAHFLSFRYFLEQYLQREPLSVVLAEAREKFETAAAELQDPRARRLFIEAVEAIATLRRVDALIYLHQLLKLWLAPHVVSTGLMLALMVVHIVQVIYFNVR